MDNSKVKEHLEKELAGIIDAAKLASEQLIDARQRAEKLQICVFQLQGQREVCEKLLADEFLVTEETEKSSIKH